MEDILIITILFGVLFIMLVVSAVVSAIETSITGANFYKIETLADKGNKKAKKALFYADKQQRVISTMLFLNNAVNIVATTITTVLVTIYIKNIPLAVATAVLTFIILIFCEITPKRIANKNSENILMFFINLIEIVLKIFFPIVVSLNFLSDCIAKFLGISLIEEEDVYTEEELKTIVDISYEKGVLQTKEKEIIQNAFEFGDRSLKDIMVPNEKVEFIDINASYDDLLNIFLDCEYTRYPIIDESIDNVVGILNVKDLIKLQKQGINNYDLKELMREPFFLNENVKISSAFRRMQKVWSNMVIVRSVNCKTIGIATLEDILEELVGEIRDEFDEF